MSLPLLTITVALLPLRHVHTPLHLLGKEGGGGRQGGSTTYVAGPEHRASQPAWQLRECRCGKRGGHLSCPVLSCRGSECGRPHLVLDSRTQNQIAQVGAGWRGEGTARVAAVWILPHTLGPDPLLSIRIFFLSVLFTCALLTVVGSYCFGYRRHGACYGASTDR